MSVAVANKAHSEKYREGFDSFVDGATFDCPKHWHTKDRFEWYKGYLDSRIISKMSSIFAKYKLDW